MISKDYEVLLEAFKKNKDRVSELVENDDKVIYYDELKDIIGMRMDGDMYSHALEEILGVKNSPLEIAMDNRWDEYGGFFSPDCNLNEKEFLIKQHYSKKK